LAALVGIDVCIGAGLIAIAFIRLGIHPPPAETRFLGKLAPIIYLVGSPAPGLLPIALGIALYRRQKSMRGVGIACGWIAISFGLFITGALIVLSARGIELNRVGDAQSGSLALFDVGVYELWWAIGWICFAFLTGVMHIWVLTRTDVRDFFRCSAV
jgi:hypothetical protein